VKTIPFGDHADIAGRQFCGFVIHREMETSLDDVIAWIIYKIVSKKPYLSEGRKGAIEKSYGE
jgi:hypothetical protein